MWSHSWLITRLPSVFILQPSALCYLFRSLTDIDRICGLFCPLLSTSVPSMVSSSRNWRERGDCGWYTDAFGSLLYGRSRMARPLDRRSPPLPLGFLCTASFLVLVTPSLPDLHARESLSLLLVTGYRIICGIFLGLWSLFSYIT